MKLILLDPDPTAARSIYDALQPAFPEAVVVHVGDEASLEAALADGAAAILTEVDLGWLNVFQLLEQLDDRGDSLPVVVVSATDDVVSAVRALQAGAWDYILKGQWRALVDALRAAARTPRSIVLRRDSILELITANFFSFRVDPDGAVTLENSSDTFRRLYGYTAPELRRMPWQKLVHAEDWATAGNALRSLLSGAERVELELRFMTSDGLTRWQQVSAWPLRNRTGSRVNRVLGLAHDVTLRKEAEQALRESEARFRTVFEEATVGMVLLDEAVRIQVANRSFCDFVGYTEAELHLRHVDEITHPEDRRQNVQYDNLLQQDARPNHLLVKRYLTRSGEVVWGRVGVSILRTEGGQRTARLAIIENITEAVRGEEALKQSQAQLVQAQKMEAVGRLAGGVAHDFNNLMTAVAGYSQLTLNELAPEDPLRENIEEILRAAARAAELTRQLLAFSRRQVLEPRTMLLDRVIVDLERMLRRLIGEDVQMDTSLNAPEGWTLLDPHQLEQVLMNLVVNARDAMPAGGHITIQTENVDLDPEASERVGVPPGPYVKVTVQDTGHGMDETVRSRIFEPFFTTKPQGTGLGLSTVFGIVQQSGGSIVVTSVLGQGTAFHIYFPRLPEGAEPAPTAAVAVPRPGGETILLVEDEDMLLQLGTRVLRRQGYCVLQARHGGEALQICENHPESIHLMVTDVVMPHLGGPQLFRRVAPLRPDMKVLFTSGYFDDTLSLPDMEGGKQAFLQKPYLPTTLVSRIRDLLDSPSPA